MPIGVLTNVERGEMETNQCNGALHPSQSAIGEQFAPVGRK